MGARNAIPRATHFSFGAYELCASDRSSQQQRRCSALPGARRTNPSVPFAIVATGRKDDATSTVRQRLIEPRAGSTVPVRCAQQQWRGARPRAPSEEAKRPTKSHPVVAPAQPAHAVRV